jgi:signal transduction histidine kinase
MLFSWFELGMMTAATPRDYLFNAWWAFLPGSIGLIAFAWFAYLQLHGSKWLFVTYGSLRILAIILHLIMANGINFRQVTSVVGRTVLGETLSYPIAVPNPWMVLPHLSHVLLIIFFLDASVRCWRRGERRQALTFGTGTILFGMTILLFALSVLWGFVPVPIASTFAVLFIIVPMLYELNYDMQRAAMLTEKLEEREIRLTETVDQLQLSAEAATLANQALDQLNAELEHRIASRTAALNDKTRELESFAYSVAHDLKAPLRGIDGYSHLLIADYSKDLPDEARSFLETIQASTNEMNQLIDDLLAYSRLERREFKPDHVDLNPLINRLVEQKKREYSDGQLDFVVNVNAGTILGDGDALRQSLRNYLDNAVKFTQKVPQPSIEVGAKETANGCVLWVSDNGIGFDSKRQDQIFGMFQRLNSSEDYPGTGIGLAIVRKAMERMRGRAWAESSPGQGATFYLEIPHGTHRDLESNEATEQTNPPTNVDEVIRPKQVSSVASELSIQKKS